jgi:hypothetical protein
LLDRAILNPEVWSTCSTKSDTYQTTVMTTSAGRNSRDLSTDIMPLPLDSCTYTCRRCSAMCICGRVGFKCRCQYGLLSSIRHLCVALLFPQLMHTFLRPWREERLTSSTCGTRGESCSMSCGGCLCVCTSPLCAQFDLRCVCMRNDIQTGRHAYSRATSRTARQ